MRRVVGLISGLLGIAATADVRVEGVITAEPSGDRLAGAIVRLGDRQTASRSDGRFSIAGVDAGEYELQVRYLGFEDERVVVDVRGEAVIVDVTLDDPIEEVVVYGQARSTSTSLNQQRAADNIRSVLSSDDIGQLPDANLSEALQRIPGVFLERDQGEGRFVGIRGIDPGLNVTSINGVTVPSPEGGTRAVALDVIPSELLETLEVSKSFTPDMDAAGIGGAVNVKSLSGFDARGGLLQVRVEASRNELERKTSPKMSATYRNSFAIDGRDDVFGVAAAISYFDRELGSDNVETDGGWADLETEDETEFRGAEEIEQRDYVITRRRLGATLNFDWRPAATTSFYLRSILSQFDDDEIRTREEFKFDDGEAVVGTDTHATWEGAVLERSLKDRFESQEILSVAIGGEHWVNDWSLGFGYGYSRSEEEEPGRIDTNFVIEDVTLGYSAVGDRPALFADPRSLDPSNYELDEIVLEDNLTEDVQHSVFFDVARDIALADGELQLKAGFKLKRRDKDNNEEVGVYGGFPNDPTLASFATGAPDYAINAFGPGIDAGLLARFIAENRGAFELDDGDTLASSLAGDYDLAEDVDAAYAMARLERGPLRLVGGFRIETTDFAASGRRIVFDDVTGDGDPVAQRVAFTDDYDFILPSLNVRYAFTDEVLLRAAWYQTFARPSFDQLAPGGEIEFEEDDGETELAAELGNPLLEPMEADNLDLSLEFYDAGIGVLSAGVFWKRIDSFVVLADVADQTDLTAFVGNVVIDDAEVIQPINGEEADLLGFEMAWVRQFSRLPAPWNGLSLSTNLTFTDSEATLALRDAPIELPRQSDRVANVAVSYEDERLSLRLAATYKSDALLGLEEPADPLFDVYQDAHVQLDLSARVNLSDRMIAFFTANNLTDEPFYAYFNRPRYNAQFEEYGRTFALGFQYSMR